MATNTFSHLFKFICNKKWHDLNCTADPNVNYCDGCNKNVYRANSLEEVQALTHEGVCVAFSRPPSYDQEWINEDEANQVTMGVLVGDLDPPEGEPEWEKEQKKEKRRKRNILAGLIVCGLLAHTIILIIVVLIW